MPRHVKEWHVEPHDPAGVAHLAQTAGLSPVVAQLLWNRQVRDATAARRFLEASMMQLYPPMALPGAQTAAERIWQAIRQKEKICIFGDYDADGVTGTAILVAMVQRLGGEVTFQIPHRLDHGYGLNCDALRQQKQNGVSLLVTVDCGITAVAEAAEARQLGIDLIITDHHDIKDILPDALQIVHPAKPGSDYPFAGLSGSGVAFKLAWAVAQLASGCDKVMPELREFLQDAMGLAALGLVADVVPLREENRILVRHGLQRLAANPPLGLRALIDVAQVKHQRLTAEDVSFRIAPRLNAAGRLGCAMLVVELLTTTNPARARELAMALDGFNSQRQTIERRITAEAKAMVEASGWHDAPAIVLGSLDWHAGVVGIVAGRLVEHYGRPVVLVSLKPDDAISTGSGRSLPGLSLSEALNHCASVLEGYGGHAMAAGVRIRPSRLEAFRERFCGAAAECGVTTPKLRLDAEVPLGAMTLGLLKDLERLEPCGSENPKPKFMATKVRLDGEPRKVGKDLRHVQLKLRQGQTWLRAIAFGQAERFDEIAEPGQEWSLAFVPKVNEFNGTRSVQLEIIDFQKSQRS